LNNYLNCCIIFVKLLGPSLENLFTIYLCEEVINCVGRVVLTCGKYETMGCFNYTIISLYICEGYVLVCSSEKWLFVCWGICHDEIAMKKLVELYERKLE